MKATQQLVPSSARSVIAPAGRSESAVSWPNVSSSLKKSEQNVLRSCRIQKQQQCFLLFHISICIHSSTITMQHIYQFWSIHSYFVIILMLRKMFVLQWIGTNGWNPRSAPYVCIYILLNFFSTFMQFYLFLFFG